MNIMKKNQVKKENDKANENIINCNDGIIKYKYNSNNQNPVNAGLIKISGNTYDGYEEKLPKLLDSNWTCGWWRSLNSWILSGITENNHSKIIVDNINDLSSISCKSPEAILTVKSQQFVSSIQFTMKGLSESNDNIMVVRNIELYGEIKPR